MEGDAPSPEPVVYSFIRISQSPQLRSPPMKWEKSMVTIHRTLRGWKAYVQWGAAWFPKGIIYYTAITTPVPCSPQHSTFHFGLGRSEPH